MNKKKTSNKKVQTELTPESVIRSHRQRCANQEDILNFFVRLLFMGVLILILFGVVFGITPMKNNDMFPRISSGDLLLYYRLEENIHNQDVIVFEKDGTEYVGRVVAQGGDIVEITENSELQINNSIVVENDIFYSTPQYENGITFPLELQENQYFVLCDYRENAKDSRYLGAVDKNEIKGTVITVFRRSGL